MLEESQSPHLQSYTRDRTPRFLTWLLGGSPYQGLPLICLLMEDHWVYAAPPLPLAFI